jgi:hypothetical protein
MLLRLSRDERGFTMVTVVGALLIVTLLAVTALSYATDDLPQGAHDRDRKIAYAAAEAGAQNYLYYLSQDPNYWSKCDDGTPKQINQRWSGNGGDPRTWVKVPDSRNAWYTIELLPANGKSACSATNAEASMIDKTTGTFRIRTTGRVGENGVKRSIVTNFKRQSLLDYIYFTDKETRSPLTFPSEVGTRDTRTPSGCSGTACRTLKQWALDECDRYYGNDTDGQRQNQTFQGQYRPSGSTGAWSPLSVPCTVIYFIDADVVAGPFHTNDEFTCSGSPDFGTMPADRIETSTQGQTANPADGYHGCTPHFIGTQVKNAPALDLPPTNGALYRDTAPRYRFVGYTNIKLSGASMKVTGTRENGEVLDGVSMPIPADGVVYVSNSGPNKPAGTITGDPCGGYDVTNAYGYRTDTNDGCGNLELEGKYSVNVTFTAENDIIVTNDLTRPAGDPPNPDVLLGLISNNFIRVYHPVKGCGALGCNSLDGCSNDNDPAAPIPLPIPLPLPLPLPVLKRIPLPAPNAITIDAAILSLNHSFITDNWFCGDNLGQLTVRGAIVQKFRGPVGRGTSGYIKNYSYDTRFRYRSPPKFLDPVQAAWRVQTYTEQVPAR